MLSGEQVPMNMSKPCMDKSKLSRPFNTCVHPNSGMNRSKTGRVSFSRWERLLYFQSFFVKKGHLNLNLLMLPMMKKLHKYNSSERKNHSQGISNHAYIRFCFLRGLSCFRSGGLSHGLWHREYPYTSVS